MNKKGFTLIEILAVIVLISVIVAIAVPNIRNMNKSVLEKEYNSKIENIKSASVLYAQDNLDIFPNTITVETLINAEYINSDIKINEANCNNQKGCLINPITEEIMNSIQIDIFKTNNIVSAEISAS